MKLLILLLLWPTFVFSQNKTTKVDVSKASDTPLQKRVSKKKWSWFYPYKPEKKDHWIELGNMWEKSTLYWVAAGMGWHVGRCIFTNSQTCQQYLDIIGGVGGKEGQTSGLLLAGPRWQFVNFPSDVSYSAGAFIGLTTILDNDRKKSQLAYGASYGFTTSVHENIDFKVEIRAGYGDQFFGQGFMAFYFKMDRWVDYFSNKIKKLGFEATKVTGGAVETTVITKSLEFP